MLTVSRRDSLGIGEETKIEGKWQGFNALVTTLMTLLLSWYSRSIRIPYCTLVPTRNSTTCETGSYYYSRIDGFHRFLHVLINISFLTLAFTGLPQSYAHTELAKWLFKNVISLHTAQILHYIAAAITGFYFFAHLVFLLFKLKKIGWRQMMTGPNTLVARKKDWYDLVAHIKWFFGKGPSPEFDRWTYWEKFDYYAVFWGVFVIGLSGLLRWQEEFFGNLLGGGIISLADTIHREEALLATAFIFIVHFFNTHLRASKFPMDVSVYTGESMSTSSKKNVRLNTSDWRWKGNLKSRQKKPLGLIAINRRLYLGNRRLADRILPPLPDHSRTFHGEVEPRTAADYDE